MCVIFLLNWIICIYLPPSALTPALTRENMRAFWGETGTHPLTLLTPKWAQMMINRQCGDWELNLVAGVGNPYLRYYGYMNVCGSYESVLATKWVWDLGR